MASLLTANKAISLNLTFTSVSPIRLYLLRRGIYFWKQVVLCVLLLLNSAVPPALPLCPVWVRRRRILSVCASWRRQDPRQVKKLEDTCGQLIEWFLSQVPFWQVSIRLRVGLEPRMSQAFRLWTLCCPDWRGICHPRETGWGNDDIGCSVDPPDSREKATRLISQLLQLLGLGRYVRFGTSVPGYWCVDHRCTSVIFRGCVCVCLREREGDFEFVQAVCTKFVCVSSGWCRRKGVESKREYMRENINQQGRVLSKYS